jgi:hypothetical protein
MSTDATEDGGGLSMLQCLEVVLNTVADTPLTSVCRVGRAMHASQSTIWQVMHQQQLHLYHQQEVQALGLVDYTRRQEFNQWFL